ncbi:proliferation marker protein Ki-67 isoform X2 [Mugil cephalus]|uniref:proliferation marker protein Ki-67 isoform X2 n=1 Tax=Mugil cephalus TaxID=48193 RepID=UPI001FB5A77D|nr:proliferation marker protein Ki-67 isoform X2 [Mugil cephalus]
MPLHGKIVVIKRNGGDGTEFPLTASCLFGRMPDCDIRIQLPQVSKEHCRIDLNENKEVILTNLSSVNPTLVNGEVLQQSDRLKHGDVITVIDRSFRFEYPPAPTPKKRSSVGGKTEKLKVLQHQQVCDTPIVETGDKRISEVSADPHLKDGANSDNIQRSLEKTLELESKNDDSLLQSKTNSPFNDLYQMIKKSLDVKTPWKSSSSQLQTPTSRFGTPQVGLVRKNDLKPVTCTEEKGTPKKGYPSVFAEVEGKNGGTPGSVKKQRKSIQVPSTEMVALRAEEASIPQKRISGTPQKFTVSEVIEHISAQSPKSPMRKRSTEVTPAKSAMAKDQEEQAMSAPKTEQRQRTSPRNSGKADKVKEISKKRKSGELGTDLITQQMKRKRVSFGGQLSPELFDKRLPPDSPLRKGATPRRSLSLARHKQSLLRRASVIGFIRELDQDIPGKKRTPSPKKSSSAKAASPKTPTSGKKVAKSRSPSPKAASPAKKSPKSKTPSPKAATSPAKKSPKSKTPSPKAAASPAKKSPKSKTSTPAKTPLRSGAQTPTVQGRFSVSRISTPSPTVDIDAVPDQVPSHTVTPKIPIRRKSMKSATRKTPSISKSAVKVMCRRSGISRASMKVMNSWAEIVKFGQTKTQAVAPPAKKKVIQKTMKKAASKTQTPARKLKGHMSTGHADSPVTIVVGRAHKQTVTHPTGAAPRVVMNAALYKKNMKMDEDLTGIPEMFKTPVNERKRRSLIGQSSATKTPAGAQGTSVIEPSVLNTPEETGEMIVSPLSVASTIKDRRYNSEAVQRLLNENQESSFVGDVSALESHSESNEQQSVDLKTISVTTPKQKTPRQKSGPVEDLREKSLKTPKQKAEQRECLTGVKRIMKTPRQKTEPLEDIRGRLLKTPKQKAEPQECLSGVKRIMKTPRQKTEPLEDIRGKLLKTPKLKPEPQECLTGVKRMFKTPKQGAESLEDLQGELQKTPKATEASDVNADAVKELLDTPARVKESEDLAKVISPTVCLTDIKKIGTPKEKTAPVEDMVEVKRLMRTPRVKGQPVEQNFGLKRLMKSPRVRGNAPVDDFEGLQELMEEPLTVATGQQETDKQDELQMDGAAAVEKETSEVVINDHLEVPSKQDNNATSQATEAVSTQEKKSVRGRRAKATQDKEEAPEPSQNTVLSVPVRGRRGKKTEATALPAVKQTTRGRNAKSAESVDVEIAVEESPAQPSKVAPKLKRGRNAKKATDQEVAIETDMAVELQSDQIPPVDVDQKENDSAAPKEKAVLKPKRGRTPKPKQTASEEQEIPQTDVTKDEQVLPSETDVPDAMETVVQAHETERTPVVETVEKKSVRGQRAKRVESKDAEDKQEAAEHSEEPAIPAPARGRRGKKVEASAPPAVKRTRTRNAKSQESSSDTPAVETQPMTEISSEAVSAQTSLIKSQVDADSVPPTEEAVVKPLRGRKTKQTLVEPVQPEAEENDAVSEEHLVESSHPQQPTPGKPRSGRKTSPDPVEQNVTAEDVVEETKKQSRAPVRARRGKNARQEEEKMDDDKKTTESQQPVKTSRRTRKPEQDRVEPVEEVPAIEVVVPEVAEALAEPVMSEEATVALKPRRGRKAKVDTESVTLVESTEVQDNPTQASSTDKPKRVRRGKQVAEMPENEVETEEKQNEESAAPTPKSSKARRGKAEASQAVPAKRARRGAALPVEETSTESTVPVSEPVSAPAEPAKRGRRAAAKPKPGEATVTSDETNPSEESSTAVVEDTKMSKKSVKWKLDMDVVEIPKVTPVKTVRGRKSKLEDQAGAESKKVLKGAHKPEEEDLSDEVVEAQPVKRARRGAKADVNTASTSKVVLQKEAEAETQPKTRRGRSAKK